MQQRAELECNRVDRFQGSLHVCIKVTVTFIYNFF